MRKPGLVDAHCHLADARFDHDLKRVIEASAELGIGAFVLGGISPKDWDRQLEIAAQYPGQVFPCFGLHPWFVAGRISSTEAGITEALDLLPRYLTDHRSAGVGELGLDLGAKTDPNTLPLQKQVFEKQLAIAKSFHRPLVLHIVRAHSDAIEILKTHAPHTRGGIVHAFAGSFEVAQEYLKLGLTLSIGGAAARAGHVTLKRGLKRLPLDSMVFESDSPDLIPDGFQGVVPELNDPRSLWRVVEEVLKLQSRPAWEAEGVLQASSERVRKLFELEFQPPSL